MSGLICANPTCGRALERVIIGGGRTYLRNMGDRDEPVETDKFVACSWKCLASCATALHEHEEEHADGERF